MIQNEKVIEVHNLVKRFGDFTAVDQISFDVYRGEIFGFLGANGAGKSTAMRMLCGLSIPTGGEGRVAGYDIRTQSEQIKKHIGYMSQRFSLYEDLTVKENIKLFAGVYSVPRRKIETRLQKLVEDLGMAEMQNRLVRELTQGWRQKLAFSVSIFHQPDIVFLDEPTGGVDPKARRQFWELIFKAARDGITVFVTTHYMDEAEYCDRVSMMVDGSIVAMDSPAALREHYGAESMAEVFEIIARGARRSE